MRLINTQTLELESHDGDAVPRYVILSHRWGREELLYEDLKSGLTSKQSKKKHQGIAKLKGTCHHARLGGYTHVWIDTCCIDKSSSAELSEAINSMFTWYEQSAVCFAYLADVVAGEEGSLGRSEWFRRGWTLQELIAPNEVIFFDESWTELGRRTSMSQTISSITLIPTPLLTFRDAEIAKRSGLQSYVRDRLSTFSIAARMSWASARETTRVEDRAYSLLGLFNINMPLIYGEGLKAFRRLQEEIVRESNDLSILAHNGRSPGLARGLEEFGEAGDVEAGLGEERVGLVVTNQALELTAVVCPAVFVNAVGQSEGCRLAMLNCSFSGDYLSRPGVLFHNMSEDAGARNVRRFPFPVFRVRPGEGVAVFARDPSGSHSVRYDAAEAKVEKLLIEPPGRFAISLASLMYTVRPPLRVEMGELGAYRVKHAVPDLADMAASPCDTERRDFRWCWGMYWMTDDRDPADEFLVLWGLVKKLQRIIQHYHLGWWKGYLPWCSILELGDLEWRPRPPGEGDGMAWVDELWDRNGLVMPDPGIGASRRPTGFEVEVSTSTVEFLGRRSFELRIQGRTPDTEGVPGRITELSGFELGV